MRCARRYPPVVARAPRATDVTASAIGYLNHPDSVESNRAYHHTRLPMDSAAITAALTGIVHRGDPWLGTLAAVTASDTNICPQSPQRHAIVTLVYATVYVSGSLCDNYAITAAP